jgi:hypothetical protein
MEERKESCGGCDYQGEVTQNEVECLVDDQWYKKRYWCPRWKKYVSGKNKEERLKLAIEKRREEGAEATKKEDRKFEEEMIKKQQDFETNLQTKNRKSQTKLVWLAGLISLIVSVITNLIIH